MAVDISKIESIPISPSSSLANPIDKGRVGFKLAIFLLCIIAGYIVFLILYLLLKKSAIPEISFSQITNSSDTAIFNRQLRLLENLQKQQAEQTNFLSQVSQLVLLNVCLPLLTAVLGYIFGSSTPSTTHD